jgi:hypothetical protein
VKKRHSPHDPDLDRLLEQAADYSRQMMSSAGSVPPTLMALTPDGFLMFVPKKLHGEAQKDKFANAARLIATGYEAVAVALILESWATIARRPGQAIPNTPPSQSPDREEVVFVVAETRQACRQRFLFIQRNSSGNFIGFGTSLLPEFDELQGRFAGLMPPKIPSKSDSLMARTLLQAMGVDLVGGGHDPSWN